MAVASETYTRGVSPIVVNRVLLILAFVGLFIAGVLSAGHIMDLTPPCGASHGCADVAASPASKLFGIPVAYMGFVTYLLLAVLAAARSLMSLKNVGALVWAGYAFSAIGTAFSLYLQYQSLTVIHATCLWCMSSAAIMVINLIGYALLSQSLEQNPPIGADFPKTDSYLMMGLPVVALIGIIGVVTTMKAANANINPLVQGGDIDQKSLAFLVPDKPHSIGPENAPVTVVEFADLQCPACQNAGPKLKHYREDYPNTMRIIYRHFPLTVHAFGTPSAAVSEYASEKGKFWEFAMALMGKHKEVESADELYAVAESVGLDRADLSKRIGNPNDPIYARVFADMDAGNKIGIRLTPTFFIIANGKAEVANQDQLFEKLQSSDYQKLLNSTPTTSSSPSSKAPAPQ